MTRPSDLRTRAPAGTLVLAAGAVGVYAAARAGGAAAAIPAALGVACAVALVLRGVAASDARAVGRQFDLAILTLPGALTAYLAFDSGGYFPAATGVAAILLAAALVLRLVYADQPFAGFSWPLAATVGAVALYALWILASASWSDAPARALLDFDRALLYLLALVLFGSIPRTPERLRWMAGGLALGILVVAVAALATRFFPGTFPTPTNLGDANLSWPLTYSNALGMLCALGAVLCLYFATSEREPLALRAAGAAALPVLAVTASLTVSRGPVVAAAVGIVTYLLLGRPRGTIPGLLAAAPASVIAVVVAQDKEILTSAARPVDIVTAAGEDMTIVLAICAVAAAAVRIALAPVDRWLAGLSLPPQRRRPVTIAAWTGVALVVVAIALAAGLPGEVNRQYDRFVDTARVPAPEVEVSRWDSANRGLLDNWDVALDSFRDEPLHGSGAGTYELTWYERRPADEASYNVADAHSLYLEVMSELGIVGIVLLAIVLGAMLAALAPIRRGPERPLYAALFAYVVAWCAHGAVDWDWEMPALTLGVFALGAAALATRDEAVRVGPPRDSVRVIAGLLVLAVAVTPGLLVASQHQLDDALDAYFAGNCDRAIERASASISTLSSRPEPYEVLAACQSRRDVDRRAVEAMEEAVERDPKDWRFHLQLAIARGGAGLDPEPELREALRLNPQAPQARTLLDSLEPGTLVSWDAQFEPPRVGRP